MSKEHTVFVTVRGARHRVNYTRHTGGPFRVVYHVHDAFGRVVMHGGKCHEATEGEIMGYAHDSLNTGYKTGKLPIPDFC